MTRYLAAGCFLWIVAPGAFAQAPPDVEWPSYGSSLASTKYSALDDIDAENFSELEMAWRWRSVDALLTMEVDGGVWHGSAKDIFEAQLEEDPERWSLGQPPRINNLKATPVMVGGVLYLTTPLYRGVAIDAAAGQTLWVYDPMSYQKGSPTNVLGFNHRGVAYWSDGEDDERVLWGTGDGYLVSVDARTGRPSPGFGEDGRIDLMDGLPRAVRGEKDFKGRLTYSVASPPIVVGDVLMTPNSINDDRTRKEEIPGWMRGYDVRTGRLLWTFHTVPEAGEPGFETWENDSWKYSGNTNVWSMMSADEELGYVYLPISTATSDYYGGHRLGDNLFAESLVCLDAKTGERVWHFQMVHHGVWDYDVPAAPNLVDITVDGKPIRAVAQITKQGFVFVFDRVTGKPVWPIEERPVPPATMPGDVASPTQPFPTKPAPFEYQGVTLDDLIDFTPGLRAEAEALVEKYKLGPLFTPPSLPSDDGKEATLQRPGISGGANWWGAAIDPETGWLYVPSLNFPSAMRFFEPDANEGATLPYTHTYRTAAVMLDSGLPIVKPPYSRMTAIDLNTGEHVWMQPNGNGDRIRNHPLLKGLDLPPLGGDGAGGPLLTKTLLISALWAGGTTGGPRLVARDKATGAEVGSLDLPGLGIGTPMTYRLDGVQYIAMTVQGNPPEIVAFRLP